MSNPDIELARHIVERTHTHLFLTGKAGTGKTTFLRRLRDESAKRMVVLAPTGIAAINAGGVTIHSFLQIPFGPYVPGTQQAHPTFKMSKQKIRLISSLDLIVIDEISMVRADLLDSMDAALRRYRNPSLPFGGVQLLMIGDLQQLSPVVRDEDWALLSQHYSSPFFFASRALQEASFVTVELHKVYRQNDEHFVHLLNNVREGKADAATLHALNTRYVPDFCPPRSESYVRLMTHNHQADLFNENQLAALPSQPYVYTCRTSGTFPESSYPAAAQLTLKMGAQVMFVKNDNNHPRRYFNGLLGEVIDLDTDSVTVQSQDGEVIEVQAEQWTNARYQLNEKTKEIEEVVEGTFEQIPLRTAWAITIHKSQGLTFERAIIDASAAFAHGQTYVALSRCRTLEGLVLSAPLPPQAIIQDNSVLQFTQHIAQQVPTSAQVSAMERTFYFQLLNELFDFRPLRHALAAFLRLLEEHFYRALPALVGDYRALSEAFRTQVDEVATRFRPQYEHLVATTDYQHHAPLQERVRRGAQYFHQSLDSLWEQLRITTLNTGNKELGKRVERLTQELREALRTKREELHYVAEEGFQMDSYQRIRAIAALGEEEKPTPRRTRKTPSPKAEVKALLQAARASQASSSSPSAPRKKPTPPKTPRVDSHAITYQLYQQGLTPEEIAMERQLKVSTIFAHLEPYLQSGQVALSDLVPPHLIARLRAYRSELRASGASLPSSLTEIRQAVGEDIDFGQIRLFLVAEA